MKKLLLQLSCVVLLGVASCNKDYNGSNTGNAGNSEDIEITEVSKSTGNAGDTIVLKGVFKNTSSVYFGPVQMGLISRSDTEISFRVPNGTGSAFIVVRAGNLQSNKILFTYAIPPIPEGYKLGSEYYNIDTVAMFPVGPGTTYMVLDFYNVAGGLPIRGYFTTVDVTSPYIKIRSVLAKDSVMGAETVPEMAVRKSAPGSVLFAGINTGNFSTSTGRYTYASVVDGVVATTNSQLQSFTPVYFNGNTIYFDPIIYNTWVVLPSGQSLSFRKVNDSRGTDDLILFNHLRGVSTQTNIYGTELGVVPVDGTWGNYKDVPVKVIAKTDRGVTGNMRIPAGGAVVTGHDVQDTSTLKYVNVGDVLRVTSYISSTSGVMAQHLIPGNIRILQNGNSINGNNTRTSNTAIATNSDKSRIVYALVESAEADRFEAATLSEFTDMLKLLGMSQASTLLGGAYSTMYVKGIGYNAEGLVNRPNNTTTAPVVAGGIYAVSTAPSDNAIAKIISESYHLKVRKDSAVTPVFFGLNQYDHAVANVSGGVALTIDAPLGIISGGTFTAGQTEGTAELTATYNGFTTKIRVQVIP